MKKFISIVLCLAFCLSLSGTALAAKKTESCVNGMVIGELASARMNMPSYLGEISRLYHYYVPTTYRPNKKMPLMIVLHGSGSNALWQLGETNFIEIAEREGFIVLAPNSVAIHQSTQEISSEGYTAAQLGVDASFVRWNALPSYDPQNLYGIDDVAYISNLIDLFVANLNVDARRVYATGLSHGAFMSIRLALTIPEKLAGIAPVAGLLGGEYEGVVPADDVKIVFINGDADPVVPHTGMFYPQYGIPVYAYSLDDTVAKFLSYYGLKNDPKVTVLPQTAEGDPTRIVRYEYKKGGSASIVKYIVEGGGHTWPGGTQYLPELYIGKLSRQASASELIWSELRNVHK